MGCMFGGINFGNTGTQPTSRSRLLLDQRTPAEKEMSEEAKQHRRTVWGVLCGTFVLFVVVGAIVFYLFLYEELFHSNDDNWSLNKITLQQGFKIEEYVTGNAINKMSKPRSLHVSEYGSSTIIYVGSATAFVYGLVDLNSDGRNDAVFTIWQSTQSFAAYSVTVNEAQQTLYIDDMNGNIWRCPNVHQQVLNMRSPDERLQNCSIWMQNIPSGLYNTHYMAINPNDNNLCIALGFGSVEGTIRCFNGYNAPSMNDTTVYANGVRNSVGFEFHPTAQQQLWFTDCAPDGTSPDFPDDELNKVSVIGKHFGYPYCVTQGFGDVHQRTVGLTANVENEEFDVNCSEDEYIPGYQPLGPHVASLGMKFVFSESFPTPMSNRFILMAQHGSGGREPPIGYRIMIAELFGAGFEEIVYDGYKIFAQGWLDDETQEIYGRPVDVEWLRHDDSFIVSDDYRDVIYRIYYDPSQYEDEDVAESE